MQQKKRIIYTIGHSNRSFDDFVSLLREYGIEQIIDVRTIPRSRHNPQFNQGVLRQKLKNRHIAYRHMKLLGGLRHARVDSINRGWHNLSFRGFADYMQSESFSIGLMRLLNYAKKKRVAIMCAEAVPWRCHRSLIGDALLLHNVAVEDIISRSQIRVHTLTPWARVRHGKLIYPEQKKVK